MASEGAYLFGKQRMPAFCEALGIPVKDLRDRFVFMDQGIDLTNRKQVDEVRLRAFAPHIVMIDTLAQSTPGVDSNDKAMGDILGTNGPVGRIRRALNVLVIVIAHPPKTSPMYDDISRHGSIKGNTDMLVAFIYKKDKRVVRMKCTRNKNGPEDMIKWFSIPASGFPVPEEIDDPGIDLDEKAPRYKEQKLSYDQQQAADIRTICLKSKAVSFEICMKNKAVAMALRELVQKRLSDAVLRAIPDSYEAKDASNKLRKLDQQTAEEWISHKEKELKNLQIRNSGKSDSPYHELIGCQEGVGKNKTWGWFIRKKIPEMKSLSLTSYSIY